MSDYIVSRFVFKYTLVVDTDGTTQDYYVTTHGFRTKATDTPANYYIEERVESAGSVKRSLFSGARVAGASSPSYGVTTLVNNDGGLDTFVKYAAGGYVTCYYGDDTLTFPGGYTVVYTTKVFSVVAPDFDKVHVRYQDRTSDLDKAVVTAMYAGTDGLEGYSGISARKALALGKPGLMPLVLLNKELQIYGVQANAVDNSFLAGTDPFAYVFEGGVLVQRDTTGNYILSTDLLDPAQEPSPGTFRLWTGYGGVTPDPLGTYTQGEANSYTKGPVYLRMGTPPTAELRFGHRGYLQNLVTDPVTTWKFSDLCNRAGMQDVYPSNMGAVNGVVDNFDCGNRFIDDDRTYLTVMNDRAQAVLGFFGFDRLGQFYCGKLQPPDSGADTSQYTFTYENSKDFTKEPIDGMESPVWQFTVNAGKTRPMTPLTGASEEMTDLVSRDPFYTTFTGTSVETQKAFPGAKTVSIDIDGHDFQGSTDPLNFMNQFAALYGKQRDFITLSCEEFTPATLALALHDKVTLQVPRFDYTSGVLFRIIDIETNLDNKEIKFGLWGNTSDDLAWVLGGGGIPAGSGDAGGSNGGGGATPPGGGGGVNDPTNPSYTQTVMEGFGQEMLCVDTPPGIVQEYTMEDMEQITRVLADGDPGFYNTIDLHHFETLADASGTSSVMTLSNGAALSSAQSKFGGSSILFDGTNDYGVIPFSQAHRLLASNFSISFFFYVPSGVSPGVGRTILMLGSSTAWGFQLVQYSADRIEILATTNGSTPVGGITRSSVFTRNAWHWCLVHRYGANIRIFLNGTFDASFTGLSAGTAMYDFSAGIGVGASTDGVLGSAGTKTSIYIDELRIIQGLHPYPDSTAAVTVPTAQHEL